MSDGQLAADYWERDARHASFEINPHYVLQAGDRIELWIPEGATVESERGTVLVEFRSLSGCGIERHRTPWIARFGVYARLWSGSGDRLRLRRV